ncbi:MAG: RNA polymerase sigma factor [Labilithrix sp.]|nr:RNA polymerase sigma factor [Labilithrix sp.]MCW5817311.1 RNA polymerase sigma factor [Labilithrix sp.]
MLWPTVVARESVLAEALEDRIARGHPDAIVEAYRAHHAHVRAFAERLVGDRMAAEDLVHEVFVALPDSMRRFEGQCSLRTWLIAIAARRAQNHVRTAQRRRRAESGLAFEPRPDPTRPDEAAERAELATLLTRALDALPLDQRVAFVLCEVEERTSVEAAQMLDTSDGTVRARVHLAKKKLRAELERLAPTTPRAKEAP